MMKRERDLINKRVAHVMKVSELTVYDIVHYYTKYLTKTCCIIQKLSILRIWNNKISSREPQAPDIPIYQGSRS